MCCACAVFCNQKDVQEGKPHPHKTTMREHVLAADPTAGAIHAGPIASAVQRNPNPNPLSPLRQEIRSVSITFGAWTNCVGFQVTGLRIRASCCTDWCRE